MGAFLAFRGGGLIIKMVLGVIALGLVSGLVFFLVNMGSIKTQRDVAVDQLENCSAQFDKMLDDIAGLEDTEAEIGRKVTQYQWDRMQEVEDAEIDR